MEEGEAAERLKASLRRVLTEENAAEPLAAVLLPILEELAARKLPPARLKALAEAVLAPELGVR